MNTVTYLHKQFTNLNAVLHGIAGDLTGEEWLTRRAPGQNMIGYTVWHIPRRQDHFLQTWIRGQTELVHGDRQVIFFASVVVILITGKFLPARGLDHHGQIFIHNLINL